jgi:hypothetical protein
MNTQSSDSDSQNSSRSISISDTENDLDETGIKYNADLFNITPSNLSSNIDLSLNDTENFEHELDFSFDIKAEILSEAKFLLKPEPNQTKLTSEQNWPQLVKLELENRKYLEYLENLNTLYYRSPFGTYTPLIGVGNNYKFNNCLYNCKSEIEILGLLLAKYNLIFKLENQETV